MKKLLLALLFIFPVFASAQQASFIVLTGAGDKYIKPVGSLWGLQWPGLATSTTGCLSINASGWITPSGSACGGSGSATFGTTSLSALYPVVYTQSSSLAQFSLAFGTTTQNFWSLYNNFSSLFATSASTTNATTTNFHITSLTNSGLGVDANGRVYAAATSTLSSISGTLALTQLANQAANTVLVNQTGASAAPTALATSTFGNGLFGVGTNGTVLSEVSGIPTWVATSTLFTNSSATVTGLLSSTDWSTFNNKGSGTVTSISVASSNGFAGSSSGGATPALTLTTSITGLLSGNGTAISAAALTNFPTQAANTVIGNMTGATAVPTAFATSSLFTGTAGQTAYFSGTGTLIGTSTLFISTGSNVGIGTTSPASLFSVAGNGYFTGNLGLGKVATDKLNILAAPSAGGSSGITINTTIGGQLTLQQTGSAYSYNGVSANDNLLYSSGGALSLLSDGQAIKFIAGSTETMRLTTAGNVGIGTSSPFSLSAIHAFANNQTYFPFLFAIASSTQTATSTLFTTTAGGQTSTCAAITDLATSTAIAINWAQSCNQLNIRTGTVAVTITISNVTFGGNKTITVANPNGTAGAITWKYSGGIQWCGNALPTQTTGANRMDIWSFTPTQGTSTSSVTPMLGGCATAF